MFTSCTVSIPSLELAIRLEKEDMSKPLVGLNINAPATPITAEIRAVITNTSSVLVSIFTSAIMQGTILRTKDETEEEEDVDEGDDFEEEYEQEDEYEEEYGYE